ncbi:MAG: alginate export family protein [Candidatus Omnitrophota bacterium]
MRTLLVILFFFCAATSVFLRPQEIFGQQAKRRIEEEARRDLATTEAGPEENNRQWLLDYGAWLNYRYIKYRNDDNDASTEDLLKKRHWIDSRLWMKLALKPALEAPFENEHYLYLRVKDLMLDDRPKETAGGWDHDGPHLEYAYVNLDVRPLWIKLGRQYLSVGQGIAYSGVFDGAQILFLFPKWDLRAFAANTLPHEENIDISVPGYDKESDRYFYGLEYSYLGFSRSTFYGYAIIQRDESDERPQDPSHDFQYNSEYFGAGSRGKVGSVLTYDLELIKQTGKSIIYNTDEKKSVDAWAAGFKMTYQPAVYARPRLFFEYAFGSGDSDRVSVTDTQNGNVFGKDRNFLYFGYLFTGLALSPRLSNLHLYRTGVSLRPLEKCSFFKNMTLGVDYYRFYKDKTAGGIDDPQASEAKDDVGSEIDVTLGWRIFSDMGCSLEYGHFMPGKAYPDSSNDSQDYFSLSTTFTF